jgi:hypothetical protein
LEQLRVERPRVVLQSRLLRKPLQS